MSKNDGDLILGKYVVGKRSVVGDPRRKWEDRVYTSLIERSNDEPLLVGIVADGVGSADFGARGAELAISTVVTELKNSQGSDIPALIEHAVEEANRAVNADNQENDGDGLSTLVVSVIFQDRCFVGNVGDSRAYWVRGKNEKILQLTRDHTYYTIYGGDPNAANAGVVVNAIGRKPDVQVDLGFYLEPNIEQEKAYRLGYAGIPLQPGDAIVLCSDGLIKNDHHGQPYIKADEIIEAVQTESETDKASIKLVGQAEGRRPDDNVSAVTIQYLTSKIIKDMKSRTNRAQLQRALVRIGIGMFALLAVGLISFLGYQLKNQKPSTVTIIWTSTPAPSPTPTQPIQPGDAIVDEIYGDGANVTIRQILKPATSVFSSDAGLKIRIAEPSGKQGFIYLFGHSAMQLDFGQKMFPLLQTGALYIKPGSDSADVHFSQWSDAVATVSGSRMIVEIQENEIWIYCFEGKCQLFVGDEGKTIPVGSKRVYNASSNLWGDVIQMSYDELWAWNTKCNFCMFEIIPTPTPTATPVQSQPTKKPKDSTYGAGFNWDDRFAASEMQRENIALKRNASFSIIFSIFLAFVSSNKSMRQWKLAPYLGLFTIILFALAMT